MIRSVVVRAKPTEGLTCLPEIQTSPHLAHAAELLRLACCVLDYLGRESDIIRVIKKSLLLFLPVVLRRLLLTLHQGLSN